MNHFLRGLLAVLILLAGNLAHAQSDTYHGGRFTRGTGTNANYHSFIIPMDFQQGLECAPTGGVASVLMPWTTGSPLLYHFNGTNAASTNNLNLRLKVSNPIAGFGSRVGGSPLYIGQQYRFGVYAGIVDALSFQLLIHTFQNNQTNLAYLGATYIDLPWVGFTNTWMQFQTNGYTLTVTTNGLTTIIGYQPVLSRWGNTWRGNMTLTHFADGTATNKIYQVELAGLHETGYPMVALGNGQVAWSPLYSIEFDKRPALRSIFVDQPHFDGEPLPPTYAGKAVEELLTNNLVATTFSLTNAANTYTNLDQSPELRRHPLLDRLVTDLRRDPVALARYVQNEIRVTDGFSYNDNGSVNEVSVNAGGVSRGALATYLEGQGSPTEQCALLVYLLRQAGISSVYVYPQHNGMKLLDTQLSKSLRMQLAGAVNDLTQTYTNSRVIPVNYPWVAAYIGTNWVHLFPWLKDTELVEGLNLYDYMSTNYNNGFKWMRDYALGKTNVLAFAGQDDTPLGFYTKFLQNELKNNAPGLSLDDVGYTWRDRHQPYARWQDFPRPWITPTTAVALDSLSSSAITNVYSGLTNIFDTITVEAWSTANPSKKVSSGAVRLLDIHNRRLLIRHEKTGANTHNLILSLASFRTNATGPTNFTVGGTLLNQQYTNTALNSGDNDITIRVTAKRHQSLPLSVSTNPPTHWEAYPGMTEQVLLTADRTIKKGDLVAVCVDVGQVSRAMLNVQAEELWNMERAIAVNPSVTNSISTELYQGGTAYLMGMSYFERAGRFQETLEKLTKNRKVSSFCWGLSGLSAKRVSGALPNNGDIILVQPKVDMALNESVVVGNHTIHPDSGIDPQNAAHDYRAIYLAEYSAEEHFIINSFFGQKDAISTIKLLQLSQQRSNNVLVLNTANYVAAGNSTYGGIQLKNHDAALWLLVTNFLNRASVSNLNVAYVTPGAVTNASNSYKGMGALLWSPYFENAALIGGNLNGGVGNSLPDSSFAAGNLGNYSLSLDPSGNFNVNLASPGSGNTVLAPDLYAAYDAGGVSGYANNNFYNYSTFQNQWTGDVLDLLGLTAGTGNQNFANSIGAANGNAGYLGWLTDGLSQSSSGVSDPVHMVTGEFYVTATDLGLPGPMPLLINRNYSSLNTADNQFGYGWKLNYMPYLSVSSDSKILYAAEPDGAVIAYEQTTTNAAIYLPTTAKNPQLNNNTQYGVGSVANRLRNRIEKEVNGGNTFYYLYTPDGSLRTFQVLTFSGGAVSRTRPYLTFWDDHRGNYFSFEYGTDASAPDFGEVRRIQSSNGGYLGFYYDVYGHIIEAYAGDGRRLRYDYDQYGDMVKVTFPDVSILQYEYEHKTQNVTNGAVVTTNTFSTHLITKEIKPDGRLLVNAYDSQRRVTNQLATVGLDLTPVRNASFAYSNNFNLTNSFTNTITGYTLITDVNNQTSRYDYSSGLITNITDQAGQSVVQQWYADNATAPGYPRSLWKKRDQRGLWIEMKYDAYGNITNTVTSGDLTGDGGTQYATNTVTYNALNLPIETIDPATNRTVTQYHADYPFLPEYVIRYAGATVISTNKMVYYNVTNTFVSGGVTYTNTAFGLMQQQIRAFNSADAATNIWTHDGRGFLTQSVRLTGTSDPAVTNTFYYGDRGELMEQADGIGRATRFSYDGLGRPTAREVFAAGQSQPMFWEYSYYNENGELTWSDGPRFDPEDYVWRDYDGSGRLTTEIRWRSQAYTDGSGVAASPGDLLFATTFQQYDTFGNLVKTIDPRSSTTTNTWDTVGRLLSTKVYKFDGTLESSEGFAYEPGGQVTRHTNALSGISTTLYTTAGQIKSRQSPDGSTNAWRYYLDGRPKREIQRNGNYLETTYDDANRRTTRIFYTAAGTALGTNVTEFDRRGNAIRLVDVAGIANTNLFDGLDRLKWTMGPAITFDPPDGVPLPGGGSSTTVQNRTTNYYSAAGELLTTGNALGEKTLVYSDALGRPTRTEIRSANNTLIRESGTAYAANHHSMTVTNGSGASAIITTTYTDTFGKPVLNINYPAGNIREFTYREYSLAGDLEYEGHSSVSNSVQTDWKYTGYLLDGHGRPRVQFDKDNATTTFDYDLAGNLTNRVMPGGLAWNATFNNANQITKEWTTGTGGANTRTNLYAYFNSSSPFAGLLQTRTDGRGVACTHAYDDYLRVSTNTYSGALPEENLTSVRTYDIRGLVTSMTENYASTNTGPGSTILRSYDAYGHLINETVKAGATEISHSAVTWDSAGRRKGLGYGSFGYSYAWQADGLLASVTAPPGSGSYAYNTAGLLTNRTVGARVTSITSRDGAGRPLTLDNKINGVSKLAETLTWTGDGLPASHVLTRVDFTDNRAFSYSTSTRRLVEERLDLSGSLRWTNSYTFDAGAASGPGVLTRQGEPATGGVAWKGGKDAFGRINLETNNVAHRPAYGRVNGLATVTGTLDGRAVPITLTGTNWNTLLELTPGTHQLVMEAVHPSGMFTTNKSVWFTNNASDRVEASYSASGVLTNRVWKKASGTTYRTQSLVWDAKGRLTKATERDASNNGRNFAVVYDPLGRRVQTTEIVVTNSLALTNTPIIVAHLFDPLVEFLELGVTENGRTSWKLVGPDFDGIYGGQNGTGGFEADIPSPELIHPTLADAFGNVHAAYDQNHATYQWNDSRLTAYGSVPGYRPLTLGSGGSLAAKAAWRNRPTDAIGYVWMGGNWLDPESGRFLSFDEQGFAAGSSGTGYDAFNGNPYGYWDADGRIVIQQWQARQVELLNQGGVWNNIKAAAISAKYASTSLFSLGSFNKNDRLADRNLAGEISDAQFYGGMTINAAAAGASLYTGGAVGTYVAGRLIVAGATPLVGLTASGAASGLVASVTDIATTRAGYAATGIEYEPTIGQDLSSVGFSTAVGAGFGAITYAGMRGEGIIYNRVDANGAVDPYYGQAKSSERYTTRQAEHDKKLPNADFEFEPVDAGRPGRDLDFIEQWWISANGGSRSQNPNTPLSNGNRAMNDLDFWSTISGAMFNSGVMGAYGNGASGVTLSKGH